MARVALPQACNLLLQSEAMATSPWTIGAHTTATNNTTDVTDPLGGNTATKLVYDGTGSAGGQLFLQSLGSVPAGTLMANGFWVCLATGSTTLLLTTNAGLDSTSVAIDTTWRFVETDAVAPTAGAWIPLTFRGTGDNAARTYYVAFALAQKVRKLNRVAYVKTTTSAVSAGVRGLASGRAAVSSRVAKSGRVAP